MPVEKVCPYVMRGAGHGAEVLVFSHPLAGIQLVKGTLEPGECVEAGALRELAEESGLTGSVVADGWSSPDITDGQIWHFVPVAVPSPSDRFVHFCADDGGHRFAFFWWPLGKMPGPEWHEIFARALGEIRARHQ